MAITIEKHQFTSMTSLFADIMENMSTNGFTLLNLNDQTPSGSPDFATATKALFAVTDSVDPIAVEDTDTEHANYALRQPWRMAFDLDPVKQAIRIYACTPTNIKMNGQAYDISVSKVDKRPTSGQFYRQLTSRSGLLTTNSGHTFFSNVASDATGVVAITGVDWTAPAQMDEPDNLQYTLRYEHFGFDIEKIDKEAIPLSYRMSISDHGIALCVWPEGYDNTGDKFFWFNIQRLVDKDTGAPIIGDEEEGIQGKAPLFCVFSMTGSGGPQENPNIGAPWIHGAYMFTVREFDIHAPTMPVSATIDTADNTRVFNSVEQVSHYEGNKMVITMLKGFNTQRFIYPHEMDMVAIVSADVTSQFSDIPVTQYGEPEPRVFKALKANFANNRGARLLMLSKGAGIGA
jgi:hypothetical protein